MKTERRIHVQLTALAVMVCVMGVGAALAAPAAAIPSLAPVVLSGVGRNGNDAIHAQEMVNWIRTHGRLPTTEELGSDRQLRRMWNGYQNWVSGLQDRQRDLQRDAFQQARRNRDEAQRLYDAAQSAFRQKNYPESIRLLLSILGSLDFAWRHSEARSALDELEKLAAADLAKARKLLADGKTDEATTAFQDLVKQFPGSPSAQAATKDLAPLQRKATSRSAADRAATLLKQAEDAFAAKQYAQAYSLYDGLAKGYADTDQGKAAAAKLLEMSKDPEVSALLQKQRAEAQAQSLLAQAKSYIAAKMPDKATPRLTELVLKHPDSPAAPEARDLLKSIGASVPVPTTPSTPTP